VEYNATWSDDNTDISENVPLPCSSYWNQEIEEVKKYLLARSIYLSGLKM
jgi:hypothetical protein